MRLCTSLALACLVVPLVACHTMRFELTKQTHESVVTVRKAYFIGGLTPARYVDVAKHCPHGVAAVREETTFGDGSSASSP